MQKRLCSLMLIICMMAFLVFPVLAATVSGAKANKQKAESNLNKVNNQIAGLEDEKAEADEKLNELNSQLVDILTSIAICQDEIAAKEKEIEQAKSDYAKAQEQEAAQYEAMKKRIRFMYEQGDQAYMQVLLESTDYAEMVNKADYVEQLYSYDRKLLADYVATKESVAELKEKLEDEEADLQSSNYELEQEQNALQTLIDQQRSAVADFDDRLTSAKKQAAKYKDELEKQTQLIKDLEAEEARKQKEKEEAAASKNQNSDTTPNAGADASLTAGEATDSGTSTPAGSGIGSQVVAYACQFIGNPYVFGGTSLTNGTDCSGFTQAVYAHFGISIPRDSTSQRSCGTQVSYSAAQPGDIICYAGHVALYIGNGQIIHASTERTGITYGTATYRTILSVRRIA